MFLPVLPPLEIILPVLYPIGGPQYVLEIRVEAEFSQLLLGLKHEFLKWK